MTRFRFILMAAAAIPLAAVAACSDSGTQTAAAPTGEPAAAADAVPVSDASGTTAAPTAAGGNSMAASETTTDGFAAVIAAMASSLTSPEQVATAMSAIVDAVRAAPQSEVGEFLRSGYREAPEAVRPALHYMVATAAFEAFRSPTSIGQLAADKALGYGTEKDIEGALELLSLPEVADNPSMMVQRASILLDDTYAGRDREEAIALLKRAAERDAPGAKARLDELGVAM